MAKTREIKRRIKAVANIKRITKTMQMIATARFQAAQKRATSAKPYAQKIGELVGELSGSDGADPLLVAPATKTNRVLVLVVTSNRGLCGGYNGQILRAATQFFRDNASSEIDLEVVGKKGVNFFKFAKRPVAKVHSQFTDKPTFEQIDAVADEYIKSFRTGKYDAVYVIYMSMISMSKQVAKAMQLLPMAPPVDKSKAAAAGAKPARTAVYEYSPEASTLLSELLPAAVKTQMFQCFVEAVVGEQIARMVAMKSATDAAGKMGKALGRKFNRARQAAITTELTEIIAGAASLS